MYLHLHLRIGRRQQSSPSYDDGGRMITAVDAEDRATSYTYDAVSRRTTVTDPRGITVTSVFDDAGQLIAQTSPNENRTFS